jgi:hypothetical protein
MTASATLEKTLPSTLIIDGFTLPQDSVIDGPALILSDRCDVCRAAAFVRAVHGTEKTADLLFCGNHARRNLVALVEKGWLIDDQTFLAFEKPSSPLTDEDDE